MQDKFQFMMKCFLWVGDQPGLAEAADCGWRFEEHHRAAWDGIAELPGVGTKVAADAVYGTDLRCGGHLGSIVVCGAQVSLDCPRFRRICHPERRQGRLRDLFIYFMVSIEFT